MKIVILPSSSFAGESGKDGTPYYRLRGRTTDGTAVQAVAFKETAVALGREIDRVKAGGLDLRDAAVGIELEGVEKTRKRSGADGEVREESYFSIASFHVLSGPAAELAAARGRAFAACELAAKAAASGDFETAYGTLAGFAQHFSRFDEAVGNVEGHDDEATVNPGTASLGGTTEASHVGDAPGKDDLPGSADSAPVAEAGPAAPLAHVDAEPAASGRETMPDAREEGPNVETAAGPIHVEGHEAAQQSDANDPAPSAAAAKEVSAPAPSQSAVPTSRLGFGLRAASGRPPGFGTRTTVPAAPTRTEASEDQPGSGTARVAGPSPDAERDAATEFQETPVAQAQRSPAAQRVVDAARANPGQATQGRPGFGAPRQGFRPGGAPRPRPAAAPPGPGR